MPNLFSQYRLANLYWLLLSIAVIVADQVTKMMASSSLEYGVQNPVMPMLNMTLLHNTGAAFSMLSDAGGWQRWLFSILALVISAVLVHWLATLKSDHKWTALSLSLVLGGAIGNLWDRLTMGYVVDFIDVYYQQWHWPAFNIADSAITVGAIVLVLTTLFTPSSE